MRTPWNTCSTPDAHSSTETSDHSSTPGPEGPAAGRTGRQQPRQPWPSRGTVYECHVQSHPSAHRASSLRLGPGGCRFALGEEPLISVCTGHLQCRVTGASGREAGPSRQQPKADKLFFQCVWTCVSARGMGNPVRGILCAPHRLPPGDHRSPEMAESGSLAPGPDWPQLEGPSTSRAGWPGKPVRPPAWMQLALGIRMQMFP